MLSTTPGWCNWQHTRLWIWLSWFESRPRSQSFQWNSSGVSQDSASIFPALARQIAFQLPGWSYRYDHFARSLRQLVNALCEFDALGIQFVSLHEGVDTSTPNGRLVFGIFASIAEFERELIRERVRSGLAAARAHGKRIGRPRRVVDATRIAALRAQGLPWREIARELGVGVGTVHRVAQERSKSYSVAAPVSG